MGGRCRPLHQSGALHCINPEANLDLAGKKQSGVGSSLDARIAQYISFGFEGFGGFHELHEDLKTSGVGLQSKKFESNSVQKFESLGS